MQSSTRAGSRSLRVSSAFTQWAAMSSGRVMLNLPRKDLARPVRTLSTITTSRMAYLRKLVVDVEPRIVATGRPWRRPFSPYMNGHRPRRLFGDGRFQRLVERPQDLDPAEALVIGLHQRPGRDFGAGTIHHARHGARREE